MSLLGFASRSLAEAGHIIYAGMYSHAGDTSNHEARVKAWKKDHPEADLSTVPLNLLDQHSCEAAVKQIFDEAGKLDVVVHNTGHMNYGMYRRSAHNALGDIRRSSPS